MALFVQPWVEAPQNRYSTHPPHPACNNIFATATALAGCTCHPAAIAPCLPTCARTCFASPPSAPQTASQPPAVNYLCFCLDLSALLLHNNRPPCSSSSSKQEVCNTPPVQDEGHRRGHAGHGRLGRCFPGALVAEVYQPRAGKQGGTERDGQDGV